MKSYKEVHVVYVTWKFSLTYNVILGSPNGVKDIEHLHAWWCEHADTSSVLRAGKNLIKSRMIMIDLIIVVSRSFTDHFISIRQNSASNIKNKIFNIQAEDQSESDPDIFILLADVKHHNLQFIPVPLPLKPLPLMIAYSTALFLVWKNNLWMSYLNSNLHSFKQILLVLWVENNMFAFYKWMECC